jgi:flagellar hook-associated protein 3 FlgL
MRVTTQQTYQARLSEIMKGQEALTEAQNRVSTGIKLNKPSDDPAQIAELLRTQSKSVELTRRKASIDETTPTMSATESVLGDITTALNQAKTIAQQAANATTSAAQRDVLANQLADLRQRITALANTQSNGKQLFSGTDVNTVPFDFTNPGTYAGNTTTLEMETPEGAAFPASVTGESLRHVVNGQDLFQGLASLETAVRNGDSAGMSDGMGRLDSDVNNTISLRGDMGQRLQYAQWASDRISTELDTQEGRRAQIQDADMAQSITDVARLNNGQQATLAMAARLDGPSLLDYLR